VTRAEARVEAQAKVNLFLRVLARETSGYHQIETLLCRLSLSDTVIVRATRGARSLRTAGDGVPPAGLGPPEQNLAWKAAMAYAAASGWPEGFEIEIDKRIPVGGGLGGGSADAGAVLRALDAMNPRPLAGDRLLAIAGSLGADVPFLSQAVSPLALAWGRGDRLLPLPALPERAVEILAPPEGVSTAEAYRWLDERWSNPGAGSLTIETLSTWDGVLAAAGNDFEQPVADRVPAVRDLLALRDGEAARSETELIQLTGSGSAVFAVLRSSAREGTSVLPRAAERTGARRVSTRTAAFVESVVLTH
jgi:4-diphosphocytidyl-2-C-methyl-D-erythritol kinase